MHKSVVTFEWIMKDASAVFFLLHCQKWGQVVLEVAFYVFYEFNMQQNEKLENVPIVKSFWVPIKIQMQPHKEY